MKRILLLFLVVAIIIAVLAANDSGRIPSLITNARRIPGYSSGSVTFLTRTWASPDEIVIQNGSYRGVSIQLNTHTGLQITNPFSVQPFPNFMSRINKQIGTLSPNGKMRLAQVGNRWRLADLNGVTLQEWPAWEATVLWDPNSRGWAGVDPGGRFAKHYRIGEASPRLRRIPAGLTNALWYDGGDRIGFLTGRLPTFGDIAIVRLGDNPTVARSPIQYPPETTEVTDIQASPDGSRIAWYLGRGKRTPGWADRILEYWRRLTARTTASRTNPPPMDMEGIWISRPDGSGMRAVGEVKAEWAPEGMASFTWRPDGKSVLVAYRNGIYDVPVD